MAETRRPIGYESSEQYDFVKALQLVRAGLVAGREALFLKGVSGIRIYAGRYGLTPSDLSQIVRVMKFVFSDAAGGAEYWADGLQVLGVEPNIGERMAKMVTDLIAR